MEGSRHERAVIVAISYVIGFTAAFLLYAAHSDFSNEDNGYLNESASLPAAVIQSDFSTGNTEISSAIGKVNYTDGKLEYLSNTGTRLLSFNPDITGFSKLKNLEQQGTHTRDIFYSVSDDNKQVFFCENGTREIDYCKGYIYSVEEDLIYPITENGTFPIFTSEEASEAIWSSGQLLIKNSYSANKLEPWLFITEKSAFDLQ